MYKKLLLPILLLFAASVVFAQRFDGGILAGFNATQVEGDTYKGYNKPGIVAGAYVETDIAPAVFAAMEIKFSQKGARKKVTDKDPTKYVMRLDYVEMPIYFAFRTNERGSIIGGLSTGFLLGSNEFDNYGDLAPVDQKAFKKIDLQPLIGFQFDFLDNVKADLRFAFSVLPIRNRPGPNSGNLYWINNQFNNVITLALYYQIGRQ